LLLWWWAVIAAVGSPAWDGVGGLLHRSHAVVVAWFVSPHRKHAHSAFSSSSCCCCVAPSAVVVAAAATIAVDEVDAEVEVEVD
jgi:hypothetical protein